MDNIKNDFYYVKRLLKSIEITSRYLKDKSMDDLYSSYEKTVIGYNKNETANPNDMLDYYSREQIEKYGALAIEIRPY